MATAIQAEPIVPLTVQERAGVARINEPVLMGVPLPESLYNDVSVFALKDEAGNVVPCEFRVAEKWWRDQSSIHWLHLDFQADAAAGARKTYYLCDEPASHAVTGSKLTVSDQGAFYQVNTGLVRFNVKKHNFNLIDQAWVDESGNESYDDAHKIITSHAKGFSLLSGGVRWAGSNDAASTVVVERSGPMALVLKAEGYLKNAGGTARFHFVTRIYAYNKSKIVRVVFSWENRDATVSNFVSMNGMNLEMPLNLASKRFCLGAKREMKSGTLNAGDTAILVAGKIDKYYLRGVMDDSGNTRFDGGAAKDFGALWISDGAKGMGVFEQYFWQTYPSSMEADGDGNVNLGMFSHRFTGGSTAYPPRFADHYDIYSGMSRTHEIRLVFFNDDNDSTVRTALAGVNSRLYAVAPAAWYCRGTRAFGDYLEKDNASLYTPENWALVSQYETAWRNGANRCLGNTTAMLGGKDAYDYLGWGDNPHYFMGAGELLWNGNYYDLPHVFYTHFIRTLDYNCLEYANAHAQHVQDLHQVHFEPGNGNDGACRYCPPTNHIGADELTPSIQGTTSHHKTECLYEKYCLLGDDRALEVAERGLRWIMDEIGTSFASDLGYPRRVGHVFHTLVSAYQHRQDPAVMTLLNGNIDGLKTALNGGGYNAGFGNGMGLEGLMDAYYITKRTDMPALIKQMVDFTRGSTTNFAYGPAFCYRQYGNDGYRVRADSMLGIFVAGTLLNNFEKDYAAEGRNIGKTLYFYAIPDSAANRNVGGVSLELRTMRPMGGFRLTASPNPFTSAVTLSCPGAVADLRVFDLSGRLVADLSGRAGAGEAVWKASDMAPGVYVAVARQGRQTVSAKVVLSR